MKNTSLFLSLLLIVSAFSGCAGTGNTYSLADYGLKPGTQNASPLFLSALEKIKQERKGDAPLILTLEQGTYHFYPENAATHTYYISNHDQDNPKKVGLPFEDLNNIVFDGHGSELIFHGRMLPLALLRSKNCTLKNFSIDFATPHIAQIKVLENDTLNGTLTFETAPWVTYRIENGKFYNTGEGWEMQPSAGIAFEEKTRRLVFNTSDISVGTNDVTELSPRIIKANHWKNSRLVPGTVIALRSYYRPAPGIFLSHNTDTKLQNVQVHYAEGMGLIAQVCENITLDSFSVCLKGENDPRYFTTQADATHFSGCKGAIVSVNGLYEGMMDDAINVHGTYLKVTGRPNDSTLIARYMHPQSYGFEWGRPGDTVQFIRSKTMEIAGTANYIRSIRPFDRPDWSGAKEVEITFVSPVNAAIDPAGSFGIENLTWTPEVLFADNIVRNNRARGALFSTPKKTIVENNLFDHTSGTAVLLCGDCNGWFETGACRDITIRNNRFINALTNLFQFTNAVISIYPEIPDLKGQKAYFHSGIVIENNLFETFDAPLVYAKSVNGLLFRNNTIRHTTEYPAFHWNRHPIFLQRVTGFQCEGNTFDNGFDEKRDIRQED